MRKISLMHCRNIFSFKPMQQGLVIILVLLLAVFTCGCSKVDPEELGPGESLPGPGVTPQHPGIVPPAVTTPQIPTPLPHAGLPGEQ